MPRPSKTPRRTATRPPGIRIREVVDPADPAIVPAHRLLQHAFRKSEVVSVTDWRNSLSERVAGVWEDIAWHLVVAEQHGRVIGVVTGTYLGNVNCGFIGYLTVTERGRGHGLGSRLRTRLKELFRRDAEQVRHRPLDAVVGEVRSDNPWLRHLITNPQVLALDFHYLQPSLKPGARSVPLVLYYESMRGPVSRLSAAKVRRLLYTAWRRAYRIPRPLASATFRRMLESLAGRRSIGELP